ncbi:MAG: hypothetical protein JW795_08180 [Chitinivibrionales bacterium]|nr:hypothetical protein [Chitinivibrionales bacterium]
MVKNVKVLGSFFIGVLLLLCFCNDWTSSLQQIDPVNERMLDFVFMNNQDTASCEAMPGDTMVLRAYFAGMPISTISWMVSFDVVTNMTGGDSAINEQPLSFTPVTVPQGKFTDKTYRFGLKFKIPEDMLYNSTNLKIMEPMFQKMGLSGQTVLGMLDTMTKMDTAQWKNDPQLVSLLPMLKQYLPQLLQLTSVKVMIVVRINNIYECFEYFTVRYNRYFSTVGLSHANRNPVINYYTLYKMKKPLVGGSFKVSKMGGKDTAFSLFIADTSLVHLLGKNTRRCDTICIDTAYLYYLAADTGVFNNTSYLDTAVTNIGNTAAEFWQSLWFFQVEKDEVAGVPQAERMDIYNGYTFSSFLKPPANTKITHATLWLQIFDDFYGERIRPSASTLQEKTIYFTYAQGEIRR